MLLALCLCILSVTNTEGQLFKTDSVKSQHSVPGLHPGNGCPHFFSRLAKHEPVNIVYFGGSITNHPGYRIFSEDWFKTQYPESKFTTVNVGIGGTGSDLGVFRMDQDVLEHNPDLVFVEFAVNDGGTDSLVICHSMEGIVRKIRAHNPLTDICFLYTVNQGMLDDLMQGRLYKSMRYMENIARYYNIPSVNFSARVIDLVKKDSLIFKGEKGLKLPMYPQNYEWAKSVLVFGFRNSSGWKIVPADDKIHKYYQGSSKVFPDLIVCDNPEDFIEIKFKGTVAGLFDVIGLGSGDLLMK